MGPYQHLGEAFLTMFSFYGVIIMIIGVSVGILGGALPGISTTMTVALVATAAYTMEPIWALTFLASVQIGATYGGSISATVLNIPGTPGSAATALEGYPLTKKGEAAKALSVNVISSFFGNSIGAILLLVTMPFMLKIALKFSSWEMFWFAMIGVVICANLSRGSFLKGLMSAFFGLLVGCVGMDMIVGVGRFTFGSNYLYGGLNVVTISIGLFGMAEVFNLLADIKVEAHKVNKSKLFEWGEYFKHWFMSLRAAFIGFLIGAVPGVGASIASWVGYDHARTSSKNKEKFGTGVVEGLVGSETANNACAPGAYLPMLSLGVPGDVPTAIVLGILIVQGVQPGPSFLLKHPEWVAQLVVAILLGGLIFLVIGTLLGKGIAQILKVPLPMIIAAVTLLCVIGAYAVNSNVSDVYTMLVFGVIGLLMNKNGFPIAPMLLGTILSGNFGDFYLRQGVMAGKMSLLPFVTRPVSACLIVVLVALIVFPIISTIRKSIKKKKEEKKLVSD